MRLPLEYANRPEVKALLSPTPFEAKEKSNLGKADVPEMHLRLPWPPTVNTYYRSIAVNGEIRVLISERGKAYRKEVDAVVEATGEMMASGRYAVAILSFPPDKRVRDLDNLLKSVLDSLTKAGIWPDDGHVDDLRITRSSVSKGDGFLQVSIRTIK